MFEAIKIIFLISGRIEHGQPKLESKPSKSNPQKSPLGLYSLVTLVVYLEF